ncbi:MFS transporter [Ramlibacter sp.]|uniref:MFS transporter n=1 Tax=Ramlibacter sp. TaxID=1917967 RepID=UPI003D0B1CA0
MSSISSTLPAAGAPTFRQDATLIGLVGAGHLVSHFSQLWLAPLFPWLKDEFNVSYTQLGLLLTVFFVVSCLVQAASGFLVDRHGPRPVLFGGLALLAVAGFGYAISTSYWGLMAFSVVAGLGNGVFHPVDYTLLNKKVSTPRLGHAYSLHGVTGSLGWALAPAMLVPLTIAFSWRVAVACAAGVAVFVLLVMWINARKLALPAQPAAAKPSGAPQEHTLAFMRIPAVWMCFAFFFVYAMILSVVQAFAPAAARELHQVPVALAAMCLTAYMICAAGGAVVGGFLVADPSRAERIVGIGFGTAAVIALGIATLPLPALVVPVMFGAMGVASGLAGPSRDMIVKRSTPENASGRVYGVVYSGLDIGQAFAPLIFGVLMDAGRFQGVWLGLVLLQGLLIASAFNVRRVRRTVAVPA